MKDNWMLAGLAFPLLGGLANLFFPKQVIKICEAFGRLTPFIPDGPFAGNVLVIRVSGAIMVAICLVVLGYNIFS